MFMVTSLATWSQDPPEGRRHCLAHELTERYLAEQGLPADIGRLLPPPGEGLRDGGAHVVPVVFHVVWNVQAGNIPASAIQAVVAQMNEDYSRSNPDIGGVRAAFTGSIADVGIGFCLARYDPDGNPTNGITRTQTTATWFNPNTQPHAMKAPPLGKSPWDPTRYLNIWVCDINSGSGGGIVGGYSYLPVGGMAGSDQDGLVIDYRYGMTLTARTCTHEAGHYFGLLHPWANGSCSSDDGFADTPNTDSPTWSCANPNLVKCGELNQYENFMDYSPCVSMFTNQQAGYMTGLLTGLRASLLSSTGCAFETGTPEHPAGMGVRAYPNPASGTVTVEPPFSGPAWVDLLDAQGRAVASLRTGGGRQTVALDGIAPGTYLLRVQQDEGTSLLRLQVLEGR